MTSVKYQNIIVRKKEQLVSMNPEIVSTLKTACRKQESCSLIYQPLQSKEATKDLVIDSSNRIGTIYNLRLDKEENVICDLEVFDLMKLASNFNGVIDNLIIQKVLPNKSSNHYRLKIVAFVIYDVELKEKIDNQLKQRAMTAMPKFGDVALPKDQINPLVANAGATDEETKELLDQSIPPIDMDTSENGGE